MKTLSLLCLLFSISAFAQENWTPQQEDELKVKIAAVLPQYYFEIQAPKEPNSQTGKTATFQPNTMGKGAVTSITSPP